MSKPAFTVDVTAQNFDSVVIEGSSKQTVMVDFWADWCGPCRSLTPILQKIVAERGGSVLLAKIDTERERTLAENHQIRSLPTVHIYKDGQVVEEFMGAQPESLIQMILDKHVSRASDAKRQEASEAALAGDTKRAIEILRAAHEEDPSNERIVPQLAQLLLDEDEIDAAEESLRALPANKREDDNIRQLQARIDFARVASGAPSEGQLRERIAADPADYDARLKLGARHLLAGNYETAMDEFLEIVRRDNTYREGAGRKSLLAAFEILGHTDPRVSQYRAQMSSLLL